MMLIGEIIDFFSLRGVTSVSIYHIYKNDWGHSEVEIYDRPTKDFVTSCPSWLKFKPITHFVVRKGVLTIWFGGLGK